MYSPDGNYHLSGWLDTFVNIQTRLIKLYEISLTVGTIFSLTSITIIIVNICHL